jgi:PAS domain S-box-containing protein
VPSPLLRALMLIQQSFCLSDPTLPDCPIVHASDAFMRMTGYDAADILGRNCRFLQGPDTDPDAVAQLRRDIASATPTTVRLLNYTKAGTPFWNSVHVAPIRDATGRVVLFIGVQVDVTAQVDKEMRAAAEAQHQDGGQQQAQQQQGSPPPQFGVPPDVAQMGAVGAVRVAVRGLRSDSLRRHM